MQVGLDPLLNELLSSRFGNDVWQENARCTLEISPDNGLFDRRPIGKGRTQICAGVTAHQDELNEQDQLRRSNQRVGGRR